MALDIKQQKYEIWKNALLDVSKRNQMINFRKTKRETLKILSPDMFSFYDRLVNRDENISFKVRVDYSHDAQMTRLFYLMDKLETPVEVTKGEIDTEVSVDESNRILKQLRSRSRLSLEEQGINILYLSFGFLKWKQKASEKEILAPLVMVPVGLMIESFGSPYMLGRLDEDIELNPTLDYVLSSEYGIRLPKFDPAKTDLSAYLDQIEQAVTPLGWQVRREVYLGLLSFLKIIMYRDLEKYRERIFENPVIRAFCGDTSGLPQWDPSMADYPHDMDRAMDTWQVVNSDSSQQDALRMARKGYSFVLQGPPGTGKSQTITNMIAEGLADGKKILFVSEKMAALRVVYHRLEEANLAEYCLSLHNYKADKKEVIRELVASLDAPRQRLNSGVLDFVPEYELQRKELDDYFTALKKERAPLQRSLYQVLTELCSLEKEPLFRVPGSVLKITGSEYQERLVSLELYREFLENYTGNIRTNSWRNTNITLVTFDLQKSLQQLAGELSVAMMGICSLLNLLKDDYAIGEDWSWNDFRGFIQQVAQAKLLSVLSVKILEEYGKIYSGSFTAETCRKLTVRMEAAGQELKAMGYLPEMLDSSAQREEEKKRLRASQEKADRIYSFMAEYQQYFSADDGLEKSALEKQLAFLEATLLSAETDLAWYERNACDQEASALSKLFSLRDSVYAADQAVESLIGTASPASSTPRRRKITQLKDLYDVWQGKIAAMKPVWERVSGEMKAFCRHPETFRQAEGLRQSLQREIEKIEKVQHFVEAVDQEVKMQYRTVWDGLDRIRLISQILMIPYPYRLEWVSGGRKDAVLLLAGEMEHLAEPLRRLKDQLRIDWREEFLTFDCEEMYRRFKLDYSSFFKRIGGTYKADKQTLLAMRKNVDRKLEDPVCLEGLESLRKYQEIKKEFDRKATEAAAVFAGYYKGEDTDWRRIRMVLNHCQPLFEYYENYGMTVELSELLESSYEVRRYTKLNGIWAEELASGELIQEYFSWIAPYRKENPEDIISLKKEQMGTIDSLENLRASLRESFSEEPSWSGSERPAFLEDDAPIAGIGSFFDGITAVEESLDAYMRAARTAWNREDQLRAEQISQKYREQLRAVEAYDEIVGEMASCFRAPEVDLGSRKMVSLLKHYAEVKDFLNSEKEVVENRFLERGTGAFWAKSDGLFTLLGEYSEHAEESVDRVLGQYGGVLAAHDEKQRREFSGSDLRSREEGERRLVYAGSALRHPEEKAARVASEETEEDLWEKDALQLLFAESEVRLPEEDVLLRYAAFFEEDILALPLKELAERSQNCGNMEELNSWLLYCSRSRECRKHGLESYLAYVEQEDIAPGDILPIYRKSFLTKWVLEWSNSDELKEIRQFQSYSHNHLVADFRRNDRRMLNVNQMRLNEKLSAEKPSGRSYSTNGKDEISTLLRENEKKRKVMPLRRLFREIPMLLQKLKPCFMMSPLSVSYFLDSEVYEFDMVIFDEASQILPEDAIGAIYRGKQVIIAGDTNQLPPTNFFTASAKQEEEYDSDTGEEDEYFDEVSDSILDEAGKYLPYRQTLLWHYRSKDESLIAFSNREIYANRLTTFPNCRKEADLGLEYIFVKNGMYESGKRCNVEEAKRCVRLLEEHVKKHPDRSLGIIAFSEKQQGVISDAVQEWRQKNPQYDGFFQEDKNEPFFVKNLESVQGDERDTIMISICYARKQDGKMALLGPLSHAGGERRLNVAITRAKYNVKLVGSIRPEDIDVKETSQKGTRFLRDYIAYAMAHSSGLPKGQDMRDAPDQFPNLIAEFIRESGYSIQQNIGESQYKVDIAVRHPSCPETYMAAIECDGDNYASARTARDRDYLRQDIMKAVGWRIYHVWSFAWYKNPVYEKKRLLDFLESAARNHGEQAGPEKDPHVSIRQMTAEELEACRQIGQLTEEELEECRQIGQLTEEELEECREIGRLTEGELEASRQIGQLTEEELEECRKISRMTADELEAYGKISQMTEEELKECGKLGRMTARQLETSRKISQMTEEELEMCRKISQMTEEEPEECRKISQMTEEELEECRKISQMTEENLEEYRKIRHMSAEKPDEFGDVGHMLIAEDTRSETRKLEFEQYEVSDPMDLGFIPRIGEAANLERRMLYVLQKEQPIHIELLYRRMAPVLNRQKATEPVRQAVDRCLNGRDMRDKVRRTGDFIYLKDAGEIKARSQSTDERPIEYICPEEIRDAMTSIVAFAYGIDRDDLYAETAKIFGFARRGQKIMEILSSEFAILHKNGVLRLSDGKVYMGGAGK